MAALRFRKTIFCRLERLFQVLYFARYVWIVESALEIAGGSALVSRDWSAAICCCSSTIRSEYVAFVTFASHHWANLVATWTFAVADAVPTTLPSLVSEVVLSTVRLPQVVYGPI